VDCLPPQVNSPGLKPIVVERGKDIPVVVKFEGNQCRSCCKWKDSTIILVKVGRKRILTGNYRSKKKGRCNLTELLVAYGATPDILVEAHLTLNQQVTPNYL
jgi:hypothetical protein